MRKYTLISLPLVALVAGCNTATTTNPEPTRPSVLGLNTSGNTERTLYLRLAPSSCLKTDQNYSGKLEPTLGVLNLVDIGLLLPSDVPLSMLAVRVGQNADYLHPDNGAYFLALNNNDTDKALAYLARLERADVKCRIDQLIENNRGMQVIAKYPVGSMVPTTTGPVQREREIERRLEVIRNEVERGRLYQEAYRHVRASIRAESGEFKQTSPTNSSSPKRQPKPTAPATPVEPNTTANAGWDDFYKIAEGAIGYDCRIRSYQGCA